MHCALRAPDEAQSGQNRGCALVKWGICACTEWLVNVIVNHFHNLFHDLHMCHHSLWTEILAVEGFWHKCWKCCFWWLSWLACCSYFCVNQQRETHTRFLLMQGILLHPMYVFVCRSHKGVSTTVHFWSICCWITFSLERLPVTSPY